MATTKKTVAKVAKHFCAASHLNRVVVEEAKAKKNL